VDTIISNSPEETQAAMDNEYDQIIKMLVAMAKNPEKWVL
jgi:hypothetical protein